MHRPRGRSGRCLSSEAPAFHRSEAVPAPPRGSQGPAPHPEGHKCGSRPLGPGSSTRKKIASLAPPQGGTRAAKI